MFKSFHVTTAYGIPIRLHWSLYFAVPLFMFQFEPSFYLLFLIVYAGLLFSVGLHEIGHSILALKKGVGVSDIVLTPIGGIAKLTDLPEESGDEMQIAIAGPLVSVALALLFGALAYLMGIWQDRFLFNVTSYLCYINTSLVLFNLIPAFPMDGGRIFRAWMTPKKGRVQATRIAVEIGKYLAILGGLWGVFNGPFTLTLIALFIYMAARSEYRMVLIQEQYNRMQNPFGAAEPRSASGFSVSPPPYAAKGASRVMNFSLLRETAAAYLVLQSEFFAFLRRSFSSQ